MEIALLDMSMDMAMLCAVVYVERVVYRVCVYVNDAVTDIFGSLCIFKSAKWFYTCEIISFGCWLGVHYILKFLEYHFHHCYYHRRCRLCLYIHHGQHQYEYCASMKRFINYVTQRAASKCMVHNVMCDVIYKQRLCDVPNGTGCLPFASSNILIEEEKQ